MALKANAMSDQQIKDLMRAIATANGRPLSEDRLPPTPCQANRP